MVGVAHWPAESQQPDGHEPALQTQAPSLQAWPSAQVTQAAPLFPHADVDCVVTQPPPVSQQPPGQEVASQAPLPEPPVPLAPPLPLPPVPFAPPVAPPPPEPLAPPVPVAPAPPVPFAPARSVAAACRTGASRAGASGLARVGHLDRLEASGGEQRAEIEKQQKQKRTRTHEGTPALPSAAYGVSGPVRL